MPARRSLKASSPSRCRCRRSSKCFWEASMPPEAALLEAKGVDAGYGTMQVLWGVDLDVRAGETVLLLGANGAGKTTVLKSLVGLIGARQGAIRLGGEDVTRMRSSDRMRLGMTYMSELAVFPDLSIEENIRGGAQALRPTDPRPRAQGNHGGRRTGAGPCRPRRPRRGNVRRISRTARKAPRAGVQPLRRPASPAA